ncbi:MAG: Trk system potassium transporter TrkA [Eubacterium sp.]|nr:Trk system potassium transporter TrkA [Eubacterium sp.]
MKIVIVGCGKVGYTVAGQLAKEKHNVTVIDLNRKNIDRVTNEFDVYGVIGNGVSSAVLEEADISSAELFLALTGNDELNLVCCLVARKAGGCKTIARIHNPIYAEELNVLKNELGLAMIVNSELMAATEIARILRSPSAKKIETFAKGRVEILKYRLPENSDLCNIQIKNITSKLKIEMLIAAVERGEEVIIPNGDFELEAGDVISVVTVSKKANQMLKKAGLTNSRISNVMIIGGGGISFYLTKMLMSMGIRTTIVEKNYDKCESLSETLDGAMIIHGDAISEGVLFEEGVKDTDAFIALTNIDETNILLSLFAKKNSNAKLITKVHTLSYDDVIDNMDLDTIICPKNIVGENIIRYARALENSKGSNVETLYNIIEGKAEALEFIIKKDSAVIGKSLMELQLKDGIIIACISHGRVIEIPNGKSVIREGDSVVVVTTRKGLNDITDILA